MLVRLPTLLSEGQLAEIDAWLDRAAFVDGKATAGGMAGAEKNNLQTKPGGGEHDRMDQLVLSALTQNPAFNQAVLPHFILKPLFSRYEAGMDYGAHVDAAFMGPQRQLRTDVAVTVFLSRPEDYDGGELEIETPFGRQSVKEAAGDAVAYPASTLHRVTPVTRGERRVAVTWAQSKVRDPARREVLSDLEKLWRTLESADGRLEEAKLAFKTRANLLRMWSEG